MHAVVSDSYGDDGVRGSDGPGGCHAMGAACDIKRCCDALDASCFRTYANAGVESYACQRSCFEPDTGRPCAVLAACAQPWRDCSASGCCVAATQRCYEKNRTFASCMPECSPELPRFRGWTCVNRNGRSNEQAAALAAALSFGSAGAKGGGGGRVGVSGTMMRSIVGDKLASFGESTLGLSGKDLFLLFLTITATLTCCGLYVAGRLGRDACQSIRRKRRLASVRARTARPMRLAAQDEDEEEGEEEILGDD